MTLFKPLRAKGGGGHEINWKFGAAIILVAGVISGIHVGRTLCASEAYTAMAATQPDYAAVIRSTLRFDPGKPPLYPILLHGVVGMLGDSEIAMRLPSVFFAMANVALLMVLGAEMFTPPAGIAAAVLWALSPPAITYGAWARMYAMLVALSLGQLSLLWELRSHRSAGRALACGVLGAAMLYTHLGSILFMGAEAAMLAGAWRRGERNGPAWVALLLSGALFAPFLPIASRQVHELIFGHWVDWIGPAHQSNLAGRVAILVTAGMIVGVIAFGRRIETGEREPTRWCAALCLIPVTVLAAASLAIRPMFTMRYVAPSWAMLTLLLVALLARLGRRKFRLATAGLATALICLLPYYPWYDPWRDIARIVSAGSPSEPVFFESGYVASTAAENNPDQGFPQGFLRVPFDRYFSGPNLRLVIDPSLPAAARRTIATAASTGKGAWLIAGSDDETARAELPANCFHVEKKIAQRYSSLYHIVPTAGCAAQ